MIFAGGMLWCDSTDFTAGVTFFVSGHHVEVRLALDPADWKLDWDRCEDHVASLGPVEVLYSKKGE